MEAPVETAVEERVRRLIERDLSPDRVRHSLEVASLAAEICARFGGSVRAARIAGLGHDLARELDPARILALARADGLPLLDEELEAPILLHGRAAALLLGREAGVADEEALQAVRDHVAGRAGMGTVSLALFAADYFEPTRRIMPEAERRGALAVELHSMVLAALRGEVAWLEGRGLKVASASRGLESWLAGLTGDRRRKEDGSGIERA